MLKSSLHFPLVLPLPASAVPPPRAKWPPESHPGPRSEPLPGPPTERPSRLPGGATRVAQEGPEQRTDAASGSRGGGAPGPRPQGQTPGPGSSAEPHPTLLRGRKFTTALGSRDPPGCRWPRPARRPRGLRASERAAGTQAARGGGGGVPGQGKRSLFSNHLPRAVRLALPPRPPREGCVNILRTGVSPDPKDHPAALATPTAGP